MRRQVGGAPGKDHVSLAVLVEQQAQHGGRPGVAVKGQLSQRHIDWPGQPAPPGAGGQGPADGVDGEAATSPFG